MLDVLFAAPVLLFTVPALLSLALWATASLGLLPLDVDADFDLDTEDGGSLAFLGLGSVPTILLITLFLFAFGWLGVGVVLILPLTGWAATGVAIPVALVLALAVTAMVGKPLGKLFRSTPAASSRSLVGKVATVTSGSLTDTFGQVTIRTPSGPIELSARTEPGATLTYGDRVLIYDHDSNSGLYSVAPHVDDAFPL